MLTFAVGSFAASVALFFAVLLFVRTEERRGRRFFAAGFRGWFDRLVSRFGLAINYYVDHVSRYIIQLNWYYSVHAFLRTVMTGLIRMYEYLEAHFERNRVRARKLRAERRASARKPAPHLAAAAAHKAATALTPAEKRTLKRQKLERFE